MYSQMFGLKTLGVIIFICLLNVLNCTERKSVGLVKVYQIVPRIDDELISMVDLFKRGQLDFWRAPSKLYNPIDIMVPSEKHDEFFDYLNGHNITNVRMLVNDLAKLIIEKEGDTWQSHALKRFQKLLLRDDVDGMDDFGMPMGPFYYSYPEIVSWMRRIEEKKPLFARVFSIGRTYEGRDIYGIKFGNPINDRTKRVVWIDGGIHAREWTPIHTAIYFIYIIANQYEKDQSITEYLDNLNIVIFPCLNPDGYEYTRSGTNGDVMTRMWRKNRSPIGYVQNQNGKTEFCVGVDLNRNFAFRFGKMSSDFPCSETYHGTGPFSELESRAIRDTIMGPEFFGKIDAFITLHAYSQLWIYPYSDRPFSYPNDVEELKAVAEKATLALSRLFSTQYRYGTNPEILYAFSGGSSDWAKETATIKYSYTVELRPYFSRGGLLRMSFAYGICVPIRQSGSNMIFVHPKIIKGKELEKVLGKARDKNPFTGGSNDWAKETANIKYTYLIELRPFFPPSLSSRRGYLPFSGFILDRAQLIPTARETWEGVRVVIDTVNNRVVGSRTTLLQSQSQKCIDRTLTDVCRSWMHWNPLVCVNSRESMRKECPRTCMLC